MMDTDATLTEAVTRKITADKVTIDLIDRQKVLATSVSEHTDGTIFNMKRKRRYS